MADINLVTGYTGEAHIKSEDDALLNRFVIGNNAVINITSVFNDVDCDIDCDCVVSGRLMRTGGDVNLTFTKPSSGYYRYDAIYIVYKKVTSGIESAELVYCEGTENASQEGAEQNIGQPTIGADVVDYAMAQLYTIAWNNAQTKTVTQIAQTRNTSKYFDYSDIDDTAKDYLSDASVTVFNKNGFNYVHLMATVSATIPSTLTLITDELFNTISAFEYWQPALNYQGTPDQIPIKITDSTLNIRGSIPSGSGINITFMYPSAD